MFGNFKKIVFNNGDEPPSDGDGPDSDYSDEDGSSDGGSQGQRRPASKKSKPRGEVLSSTAAQPLSKEEMRQLRLSKIASAAATVSELPAPVPVAAESASGVLPMEAVAPSPPTFAEEHAFSAMPPMPPPINTSDKKLEPSSATPLSPAAHSSKSIVSSSTPTSSTQAGQSSPLKREHIALNAVLESVFQITFKADNANSIVRFMGSTTGVDQPLSSLLTVDKMSELICTRLSTGAEVGGAVGYLASCYKRLLAKCNEHSSSTKIHDELQKLKTEVVAFIGSSITVPEIFGSNSESSVKDLYKFIANDGSPVIEPFLKDVMNEIRDNVSEVMAEIIDLILTELDAKPASGARSVLDDMCISPAAVRVLLALCRCDKACAREVVSSKHFLVEQALQVARPSANIPAFLLHNPAMREPYSVSGAALEHRTLLGRVLRPFPSVFDPAVQQLLGDSGQQPGNIVSNNISNIRGRTAIVQKNAIDIIMALLRSGGEIKDGVMTWLVQSVVLNQESEKSQPNPLVAASEGFMINLNAVLLDICRPIISDEEKLKKVDWRYLASDEGKTVIRHDGSVMYDTTVVATPIDNSAAQAASSVAFTFVTQSFFICARALHLGFAKITETYERTMRGLSFHHDGIASRTPQAMHFLVQKICYDSALLRPELLRDLLAMAVSLCSCITGVLNSGAVAATCWRASPSDLSAAQLELLSRMPSYVLQDIISLVLFIAKTDPQVLSTQQLNSILALIVYFLRRPWAVVDYNLRADLGEALFHVFLPASAVSKHDRQLYTNAQPPSLNAAHTALIADDSFFDGQYIAPALLLLYGDVERTGYYEKLGHRKSIMIVLRHLWSLPRHRAAFRLISSSSSSPSMTATGAAASSVSSNEFLSFANGLMNETNLLVMTVMEKLADIKKNQQLMTNGPEFAKLTEEQRVQFQERLTESENHLRGNAGLCLETLNMLSYLTSDDEIRKPFLLAEILPRLVSMLLSVLIKLVGSKSLEIKIDNMDSYNFDPKTMLKDVCQCMIHFAGYNSFAEAVLNDGFYGDGTSLQKALSTVKKLHLLSDVSCDILFALYNNIESYRTQMVDFDTLTNEAPGEFLDPLLLTLMRDPVTLPTSGNTIDRATIAQHLLNDSSDPFNRQPLTISMVVPDTELKNRIDSWVAERLAAMKAEAPLGLG